MGMQTPARAPATWLTDEPGRERLLDMSPRVRALRNLTFVPQAVVLVPGASADEAAGLAEKLREAVRGAPIAGRQVTMSFGVTVSGPGGFDLDTHYGRADAALYAAKRAGRDRVSVHQG
jgi:predicted signal transduction protein with EAL and GGDEF domain